jgi:hypothetical protein
MDILHEKELQRARYECCILEVIENSKGITLAQLCDETGLKKQVVESILREYINDGIVTYIKVSYWRRFYLA